jgi:hypothetical protein
MHMALDSVEALREQLDAQRAESRARALQQRMDEFSCTEVSWSEALLELLAMLRVGSEVERAAAVDVLADVVSAAFGDAGMDIGRVVRDQGSLDDLRDVRRRLNAPPPTGGP